MTSFAICVPVYEAARPYFSDFAKSLSAAASAYPVQILLAVDDVLEQIDDLVSSLNCLPVKLIKANQGVSPAEVRSMMMRTVAAMDVDVVVFTDCDDELEKTALRNHLTALDKGDFSFSDQILIDSRGAPLNTNLFDNWDTPKVLDSSDFLSNGNFVGFSGMSILRRALSEKVISVPREVKAVDWWVAMMLLISGAKGIRTDRPVVRYRQHSMNMHGGASLTPTVEGIKKRAEIALTHFLHLPAGHDTDGRVLGLRLLLDELTDDPFGVQQRITASISPTDFWYADVIRYGLTLAGAHHRI